MIFPIQVRRKINIQTILIIGTRLIYQKKNTLVDVVKKAAKEKKVLFICWLSYSQSWAYEYLKIYIENFGTRLIYIGEGFGGCTADDNFYSLISEKGNIVQEYSIQKWEGVNDFLQLVEFNPNKVF